MFPVGSFKSRRTGDAFDPPAGLADDLRHLQGALLILGQGVLADQPRAGSSKAKPVCVMETRFPVDGFKT